MKKKEKIKIQKDSTRKTISSAVIEKPYGYDRLLYTEKLTNKLI